MLRLFKSKEQLHQVLFAAPMAISSGIFFGSMVILVSWWLLSHNIDSSKITAIESILISAYALRFIWMPIFDMISFDKICRHIGLKNIQAHRRGWIILLTYMSCIALYKAASISPAYHYNNIVYVNYIFILMLCIAAICMATSDALMIAYNCETLNPANLGIPTAAYHIGFSASSGIATVLQEQFNIAWPLIFKIIAVTIVLLISVVFFAPHDGEIQMKDAKDAFIGPIVNFKHRLHHLSQQKNWNLSSFSWMPLVLVIAFSIICKAEDRLCMPIDKFFVTSPTACNLSRSTYAGIQTFNKFLLPGAVLLSSVLINKYNYLYAFVIIIFGNALVPLMYILYIVSKSCLHNGLLTYHYISMIFCLLISLLMIIGIIAYDSKKFLKRSLQKLKEQAKKYWHVLNTYMHIIVLLILLLFFNQTTVCYKSKISNTLINNYTFNQITFLTSILIISLNKAVSGMKTSILYNYQRDLTSPEYVLQQMTIMISADKLFSLLLGSLSGVLQVKLGWHKFYMLAFVIAILPILCLYIGPIFTKEELLKDKIRKTQE